MRGAETVQKVIDGVDATANLALVEDLCHTLKFGSLCALGGFTPYPVMSAITHFPGGLCAGERPLLPPVWGGSGARHRAGRVGRTAA